ncbi:hypothetical protein STRAU_1660 [Streptomyces aurantiacus JA 4570]|uniref:Uncharacterized protein n=1 Tax=Streptomyces aurantiacus JA 4570 TaxID=1286094 RepID=S3ZP24_9ACTN|nr:hypothetical protein STRAU_1660 [Streptomyces aurantiacus JA 4570]
MLEPCLRACFPTCRRIHHRADACATESTPKARFEHSTCG